MHLRVYRNKHYSNILVCFVSILNNIEENAFWGTTMPRPVGERVRVRGAFARDERGKTLLHSDMYRDNISISKIFTRSTSSAW